MGNFESSLGGINTVLVVGLGMMGGSIAAALKKQTKMALRITAYDNHVESLQWAFKHSIIDQFYLALTQGVQQADIIIFALPVMEVRQVIQQLHDTMTSDDMKHKIVTDISSTKAYILGMFQEIYDKIPVWFVPGHPVAGSEKQGVFTSNANLFEECEVVLTPCSQTDHRALTIIMKLWYSLGANVSLMHADKHDSLLAQTSHMPHILAYLLMQAMSDDSGSEYLLRYAGTGLKDFSRIAESNPTIWRDIILSNRDNIIIEINKLCDSLNHLVQHVQTNDDNALLDQLKQGYCVRKKFSKLLNRRADMSKSKKSKHFIKFIASPCENLQGALIVPGDKSISHRAIILGALANGSTTIFDFLEGEDALATLKAFKKMGVEIEGPIDGVVKIVGVGMHGLQQPSSSLNLGNAGTAMRLMAGLMAAQSFDSELTGDKSLCGRPMKRVTMPLQKMGAKISARDGEFPPLSIEGRQTLRGIKYDMSVSSAQVQSALLLAGMYAQGETIVTTPSPVRDHTARMLKTFGYPVAQKGNQVSLAGGHHLQAVSIHVPCDISSAAFFMVAATISNNAEIVLPRVGVNPTRTGIVDILQLMGADIALDNRSLIGDEPVADIRIRTAELTGITVPPELVSRTIDEFPALFIAAAMARGETLITKAQELKVKESDRLAVMADGMIALGISVELLPDGMIIKGQKNFTGGTVDSHGDHRVAMAFAIASVRATQTIHILDCANVATSFPNFIQSAKHVGLMIDCEQC